MNVAQQEMPRQPIPKFDLSVEKQKNRCLQLKLHHTPGGGGGGNFPTAEPLEECLLGEAAVFFPLPNLPMPPTVDPVPAPRPAPAPATLRSLSVPNDRPGGAFPPHKGGGDPATWGKQSSKMHYTVRCKAVAATRGLSSSFAAMHCVNYCYTRYSWHPH